MKNEDILELIKSINGLTITCPNCAETFDLSKGKLFDIREPYPKYILTKLKNQELYIKKQLKVVENNKREIYNKIININKLLKDLKKRKIERPKRVQIITKRVNIGQIVEKILPSTSKFHYNMKDCRSLFDPIDYIAFNGSTEQGKIKVISFIEIKTGEARLQKNQKVIRNIIHDGNIEMKVY